MNVSGPFRRFATWGALESELDAPSPADCVVDNANVHWVRGITVEAPNELAWEWLGQLRVAPYAYDWVDNFGRRSPRQRTPGLGPLLIGQPMLHAFRIVDVEIGRSVTIMLRTGARQRVPYARSYVLTGSPGTPSRITVHIRSRTPRRGPRRRLLEAVMGGLAIVDFVMSRRELLTLKSCAESEARGPHAGDRPVR